MEPRQWNDFVTAQQDVSFAWDWKLPIDSGVVTRLADSVSNHAQRLVVAGPRTVAWTDCTSYSLMPMVADESEKETEGLA
jgi:hypothetical protein